MGAKSRSSLNHVITEFSCYKRPYLLSGIFISIAEICYKPNILWDSTPYKIDQLGPSQYTVYMIFGIQSTGPTRRLATQQVGVHPIKENQRRRHVAHFLVGAR